MGLFRLLTFILIVFVVWRMIKNYQAALAKREIKSAKEKKLVRKEMVKCELCDIHLPKEEAINVRDSDGEYWFCSPEHKDSFNQQDS